MLVRQVLVEDSLFGDDMEVVGQADWPNRNIP
jgi:hypothetical protein